ncbi:EscU/YscU/HrcU family type III secretion system export apparatus switch protein [Ammoniphilus resinae]|uniref:Flagellar biosynthesis protein n=1 Tax=Ammoniphilus resinae TaxID=861532 RepID=A0ABS4GKI8_9BACL|nr:EscU/YscU/HrcU family type III secretion system export apparatus switch protein [Ammoniphilus resinae]MBP1930770.1 flagellar biosynthesis protein [Ammoniphilus resinae]
MSGEKRKKAVAISYNPDLYDAPTVTAKGAGAVAERILEKAREHGVPVQEDQSLVEVLAAIDLNTQIPPELYQVVAEILAMVYKMEKKSEGST